MEETIPDDMKRKIALELSPPELINLCLTNKSFKNSICDSDAFWLQKLQIDYPEEFVYVYDRGLKMTNPKGTYILRFTEISRTIENYIPEFIHDNLGKRFAKYLTKKYKKDLFKTLYNIYSKRLKVFKEHPDANEDDLEDLLLDAEGEIYNMVPDPHAENLEPRYVSLENLWNNLEFNQLLNKTKKTTLEKIKAGKMTPIYKQ